MKDDHCMGFSGSSWQRNRFCPGFSDHFSSSRFLHSNSTFFLTYTERYFLSFKGTSHLKLRKKGAAEPIRNRASCSQPGGGGDIWQYPGGEMWACQGFYWPLLTGPYKRAQVVIYDWGLGRYLKAKHFHPVRIQKIMDTVHILWYTCFSFDFFESLLLSLFPLSVTISHFSLNISISDWKIVNES